MSRVSGVPRGCLGHGVPSQVIVMCGCAIGCEREMAAHPCDVHHHAWAARPCDIHRHTWAACSC